MAEREIVCGIVAPARRRTLIGICIGYALVILDANVLNVAAPALRETLGAGPEELLWIIDAYMLAFAAFLLSAAALGDRHGVRRIFLIGLCVFTLASLACSLCQDSLQLTAARTVQGLGAALLAPSSIALIRTLYPEDALRARALAAWAAISGIAFALGPLCGGALVMKAGWQSIFLMNLPLGLGAMVLVRTGKGGSARAGGITPDPIVQGLAGLGLASLTFGLIETASAGWRSAPVQISLAIATLAAISFAFCERRKPAALRLLPGGTLRPGPVRSGLAAGAAFNFGLYGLLFALTFHLQGPIGLSPMLTGVVFLPLTATHAIVAAMLTGRLTAAWGPKRPLGLGLASCGLGAGLCAAAGIAGSSAANLIGLLIGLAVFGFGSGLTTAPMTEWVLANLPGRSIGIGSGVLNATRQVGGLVGVALIGALTVAHPEGVPLAVALLLVTFATSAAALACACTPAGDPNETAAHA